MVLGLQQLPEPEADGPRLDSYGGEELMHVQPGVAVVLGSHPPESPGTLYISNKRVFWLSDTDRSKSYAVDFLSISLHAVSTDPESYPTPCIYTQIETEADEDEELEDSDSESGETVELSKISEMRLVPSDRNQLDTLFDIFCQCAELNPEPNEDEDEENSWVFGGEEIVDDGNDSDCQVLENLGNPIGRASGDQDIAHAVVEMVDTSFEFVLHRCVLFDRSTHDYNTSEVHRVVCTVDEFSLPEIWSVLREINIPGTYNLYHRDHTGALCLLNYDSSAIKLVERIQDGFNYVHHNHSAVL